MQTVDKQQGNLLCSLVLTWKCVWKILRSFYTNRVLIWYITMYRMHNNIIYNVTLLHGKNNYWHWFAFSNNCASSDDGIIANSRFYDTKAKLQEKFIQHIYEYTELFQPLHHHFSIACQHVWHHIIERHIIERSERATVKLVYRLKRPRKASPSQEPPDVPDTLSGEPYHTHRPQSHPPPQSPRCPQNH